MMSIVMLAMAAAFCAKAVPEGADFTLTMRQSPSSEPVVVMAETADRLEVAEVDGGRRVTFAYDKGPVRRVVADRKMEECGAEYGLEVETAEGWYLERTDYPKQTYPATIGESVADDRLFSGWSKGGIVVAPGRFGPGWATDSRLPRGVVAAFVAYWDDDRGWYMAAEDPKHTMKTLGFKLTEKGMELVFSRWTFDTGVITIPYRIVSRELKRGAEPLVWQDFADLYRPFLAQQSWARTPFVQRRDIPAWLKDAPAFVRFSRQWLEHSEWIDAFTAWWRRENGDGPTVAALWGWEKAGTWWGPDYFPCHPSDEVFKRNTSLMRSRGFHPFAWPSGYNWSKTIGRRADGSYEFDYRDTFIKNAEPMLVRNRDGKPFHLDAFWLRNGSLTTICGGLPAARDWFCGVARGLGERGCDMVQVDQQVGGDLEPCYATDHGHAPGCGPWMSDAFSEQLGRLTNEFRKVEPDGVIAFEEPNPIHIDRIAIQDYRDLETGLDEYASVYNYLFHGYMPTFQSNAQRGDLYSLAWQVVDGQMPFHRPVTDDFAPSRTVVLNGGFEEGVDSVRGPVGWDRIMPNRIYEGVDVNEPVWDYAGAGNIGWLGIGYEWTSSDRHGGEHALLIDPTISTNKSHKLATVQVAQTIEGLKPGKYVLSAWAKTERGAEEASLKFGNREGGRGALAFPKAGAGWQNISSEVEVTSDGILRLIFFVKPGARVLVDDVMLADANGTEVRTDKRDWYVEYLHRWVELYRGAGRPFLFSGFQEKPPRLTCARVRRLSRSLPAVCHAAYRSLDGRHALVLANGTDQPQTVSYRWNGRDFTRTLAPAAIELIEPSSPIVEAFAASEMHRERVAKRLEIAMRLKRPEFSDLPTRKEDLDGFRRYAAEELALWKKYPGNPDVKPVVLSAADFGAVGDGVTSNDAAFVRAIEAVKALGGRPAVLKIPAGDYYFVGTKGGSAHLDLSALTNCVVTGEGPEHTRFLFGEADLIGVRLDKCCNSTFAAVEIYWKECPFSQGVVEKVDKSTNPYSLVIRHMEGTKRPDDPHYAKVMRARVCGTFDEEGHQVLGSPLFFEVANPSSAEDLGNGRFRVRLDPGHKSSYDQMNVKVGMTVVIPDRVNNTTAVRSHESRFCNFDSVWIRNSPEAAFTTGGEYVTAWKCRVFPLSPLLRLSTNADAFFNSPGTFLGKCEFRNMNDDGGNSHYHGVSLASADAVSRKIRFAQHGISKFRHGEPIQLYRAKTGELIATLHVESAIITNGASGRYCEVTVKESLPDGLLSMKSLSLGALTAEQRYALSHGVGEKPKEFADVVYAPHGRGLGYVVTGCTFADFRGIAINAQCPNTLIENNVMEYCNHGVQVSSLMMWYEGLPCYNLVVRGNSFAHTLRGINGYLSTVDGSPCNTDYIRGVLVENNSYDSVVYPVRFRNCRDIEIMDDVKPDMP